MPSRRLCFAASMTILGLMADLGYVAVDAAVKFALMHQWAETAGFSIVAVAATALAATGALTRAEREVGRG